VIEKFRYIRSKKLMELYRTLPCQRCFSDDGTVSGAHSNQYIHGKSRGIKASDEFCASLCHDCHFWLDFGQASRELKQAAWRMAHEATVRLLTMTYGKLYLDLVKTDSDTEEPPKTEW
jgi:hypothetical protein